MRFGNLRRKIATSRRKLPLPRTWHIRLELRYLERVFQYHLNKANTWDEKQEIYGELDLEKAPLLDELEVIASNGLRREAKRLRVDVRLRDDVDKKLSQYNIDKIYLTPAGFSKVRSAIRAEKKARNAKWAELRAWLTLIFALLGAVAGIFSAWTKLIAN